MIRRTLATAAVLALIAAAPAAASTPEHGFVVDGPYSVQPANGIIAILIGFTPPTGSNKGS